MSTKKKNSGEEAGKTKKIKPNLSDYRYCNKSKNTKVRQEFIDADYLHTLNKEELEFYNKFCKEYYNNNSEKDENGNWSDTNLFDKKDDSIRKELNKSNNDRNNDMFGSRRAIGQLMYLDNTTLEAVIEAQQYAEVDRFEESMADLSEPKRRRRKKKTT